MSTWRTRVGTGFAILLGAAFGACGGAPARESQAPAREPGGTAQPNAVAAAPASAAPPSAPDAWPFGAARDDASAELARLEKDFGPIKSNWVPPGKSDRYGHAEGLVAAPYAAVRARLVDFSHYNELAGPKFKSVRVVDKQPPTTDVYFNLPIMKGLVTIWYVTRFAPPQKAQGGEVIEGTFVKGNIKGMHIAFGVRPGRDDKSTVMTCDLLLSLHIPAPQPNVDEELRDACGDAINSVRRTTAAPAVPAAP